MEKLEFQSIEEELNFLKTILGKVPALILLNQIDDLNDPYSNHNVWANQATYDLIGYSREEMDTLGFEFFLKTMHPDDRAMISDALRKFDSSEAVSHGGVFRLKPKNQDYKWVIGLIMVTETKNGDPWRFLNVTIDIDQLKDTQTQVLALTKENLQLKNQLIINSLTKREKQVIRHITNGKTDKEIAKELCISPTTAKTHRHNIGQKLKLKNAAAIVHFAMQNGLY